MICLSRSLLGNAMRHVVLLVAACVAPSATASDLALPSVWRGQLTGQVHGQPFKLPVVIEFRRPLPGEKNPMHLYIGAGEPSRDIGHMLLKSAIQLRSGSKPVTLTYLSVTREGDRITATMTSSHRAEAAAANGFTGPNVSAAEASEVMRGVMTEVWGEAEMFAFTEGTRIELTLSDPIHLSGSVTGRGASYTGTSSATYQARLKASRVE